MPILIYSRLHLSSLGSNCECSCFMVSFLVVVSHAVVIFHAVVVAHAVVVIHAVVVAHSGVTAVIAHIVVAALSFTDVLLANLEVCDQWLGVPLHLNLNSPLALFHWSLAVANFFVAVK